MSKRGENIRKRSDGRWESRLLIKETGKYKYFYGKTYSEVKQKRHNFDITAQSCTATRNSRLTLDDIFGLWLSEIRVTVKRSTYLNYENIVRLHLLPMFGKLDIGSLSVGNINAELSAWLKDSSGRLSRKYIHDILSVLRAAVAFASKKYGCTINAGEIISVPLTKPNITVLSNYEQKQLIDHMLCCNEYTQIGIILCLYTGMRIGEICALKWSDIRLKEGYIDINKTMYRIKNIDRVSVGTSIPATLVVIEKPKTSSSVRRIPICGFIEKLLLESGIHDPDCYFLTGSNKYIEPRTYQNRFKHYLQNAGLQNVNFHVLRHTFATNCVMAGCDIKSLSEILGHSSVKITLDKYVHPSMDAKKDQLEKLAIYSI